VSPDFANGAITAAFSYAFNELAHRSRDIVPDDDRLREMQDHAYGILERPAGADGVKELSFGELGVVMDYSAAYLDARSQARGGYMNLSGEEFGTELYKHGDSIFFGPESLGGFGGTQFRFVGAPRGLQGVHYGGDINYFYQGFMQAARGNSLRGVHDTVIPWNVSQGNFSRIPQRLTWATFGYDYYRSRP